MTELYVHVGHGKTGTTFLQNSLTHSETALAAAGLAYPLDPRQRARILADPGRLNSGNGVGLASTPVETIAEQAQGLPRSIYSYEGLFPDLRPGRAFHSRLPELAAAFGPLRLLLFLRDPLDYLSATYQQSVRRQGAVWTHAEAARRNRYPARVLEVLQAVLGREDVLLTVHNYSRVRSRLLPCLDAWLGLPEGTLTPAASAAVNRSLTTGELRLQRALNRLAGRRAAAFGDRLSRWFPNRPPDPPALTADEADAYRTRHAATVDAVNALLPEAARLRL